MAAVDRHRLPALTFRDLVKLGERRLLEARREYVRGLRGGKHVVDAQPLRECRERLRCALSIHPRPICSVDLKEFGGDRRHAPAVAWLCRAAGRSALTRQYVE